jgi:hypothetical protein
MIKYNEWLHEIALSPGVPAFKEPEPYLKAWDKAVNSLKKAPQLQPAGDIEPEYDPQSEKAQGELYASLVKELQDLLDTLDWDEGNVVRIQQALAKVHHQGQAYLKHIQSK